jgi:hypothetical protein
MVSPDRPLKSTQRRENKGDDGERENGARKRHSRIGHAIANDNHEQQTKCPTLSGRQAAIDLEFDAAIIDMIQETEKKQSMNIGGLPASLYQLIR